MTRASSRPNARKLFIQIMIIIETFLHTLNAASFAMNQMNSANYIKCGTLPFDSWAFKMCFIAFECMTKRTNIGYVHANTLQRVYQTHLLEQFILVVVVVFFFSKCIKNNKWRYKRTSRIVTLEIKANDTLSRPYVYLSGEFDRFLCAFKRTNERTRKKNFLKFHR